MTGIGIYFAGLLIMIGLYRLAKAIENAANILAAIRSPE